MAASKYMSKHPLEYDGVNPHLFACLAKESKALESCRVFIPPTVVFEHGFPRAWYHSTASMEVKRLKRQEISIGDVCSEFENPENPSDIVATFSSLTGTGEATSTVNHYLTSGELREFLTNVSDKPKGVLQKFVKPRGVYNTVIQATWSPTFVVTEGLRCTIPLEDPTKPPIVRCATFEGSVDSTRQVALTAGVVAAVRQLCSHIVAHLFHIEHVAVSGMVVYFKMDQQDRVQLLYSTTMRIAAKTLNSAKVTEPLNLQHTFQRSDEFKQNRFISSYVAMKQDEKRREASYAQSIGSQSLFGGATTAGGSTERPQHKPKVTSTLYRQAYEALDESQRYTTRSFVSEPSAQAKSYFKRRFGNMSSPGLSHRSGTTGKKSSSSVRNNGLSPAAHAPKKLAPLHYESQLNSARTELAAGQKAEWAAWLSVQHKKVSEYVEAQRRLRREQQEEEDDDDGFNTVDRSLADEVAGGAGMQLLQVERGSGCKSLTPKSQHLASFSMSDGGVTNSGSHEDGPRLSSVPDLERSVSHQHEITAIVSRADELFADLLYDLYSYYLAVPSTGPKYAVAIVGRWQAVLPSATLCNVLGMLGAEPLTTHIFSNNTSFFSNQSGSVPSTPRSPEGPNNSVSVHVQPYYGHYDDYDPIVVPFTSHDEQAVKRTHESVRQRFQTACQRNGEIYQRVADLVVTKGLTLEQLVEPPELPAVVREARRYHEGGDGKVTASPRRETKKHEKGQPAKKGHKPKNGGAGRNRGQGHNQEQEPASSTEPVAEATTLEIAGGCESETAAAPNEQNVMNDDGEGETGTRRQSSTEQDLVEEFNKKASAKRCLVALQCIFRLRLVRRRAQQNIRSRKQPPQKPVASTGNPAGDFQREIAASVIQEFYRGRLQARQAKAQRK